MKILMLGSGSYRSSLSIRLIALANHLKEANEITVIVPSADKYNNFTPEPQAKLPGIQLVQPWQCRTHSALLNLLPYLFTSLVHIVRARAQVVYLYKPTPITILGLVPRLLFHTPIILDLDDLGSEVMKAQGQSAFQYKLVAWCERVALRYSSAVVVASTYLQATILAEWPNKKVLLLPNGVEPSDYTPLHIQEPRQAIYYFGILNRLSLVETLLRALPQVIAACPQAKITIAGGGSALEEAKQLVEQLGVSSAIAFTGWVDMLAVQQYTQFGDIAICCQPDTPTVRAASNMKVFQYMAMQSVPVVSNVGDLSSYVKHGEAGVVVAPDDVEQLATVLIALLQDTSERSRIAQTAYKLAQTEYSWESLATKLTTFIHSVGNAKKDIS